MGELSPALLVKHLWSGGLVFIGAALAALLLGRVLRSFLFSLERLEPWPAYWLFGLISVCLAYARLEVALRKRYLIKRQSQAASLLMVLVLLAAGACGLALGNSLSTETAAMRQLSLAAAVPLTLLLSLGFAAGSNLLRLPPFSGPDYRVLELKAEELDGALGVLRAQLASGSAEGRRTQLVALKGRMDSFVEELDRSMASEEMRYCSFLDLNLRSPLVLVAELLDEPALLETPELLLDLWGDWEQPVPTWITSEHRRALESLERFLGATG